MKINRLVLFSMMLTVFVNAFGDDTKPRKGGYNNSRSTKQGQKPKKNNPKNNRHNQKPRTVATVMPIAGPAVESSARNDLRASLDTTRARLDDVAGDVNTIKAILAKNNIN